MKDDPKSKSLKKEENKELPNLNKSAQIYSFLQNNPKKVTMLT